jgi:hypothetical protein
LILYENGTKYDDDNDDDVDDDINMKKEQNIIFNSSALDRT